MLFTREFEDNLSVCPRCQFHGRIGAQARFDQLLDAGYAVLPAARVPENPLNFRDSKKYSDRLKIARAANPFPDALTNALSYMHVSFGLKLFHNDGRRFSVHAHSAANVPRVADLFLHGP